MKRRCNRVFVPARRIWPSAATIAALWAVCLLTQGCGSARPRLGLSHRPEARLARAEAFLEAGRYTDALIECVELARLDPTLSGLPELERKIMTRLNEERGRAATLRAATDADRMNVEIEAGKTVPATYGLRRSIAGEAAPLRAPMSPMEKALQKKVTVHLEHVGLNEFIMHLGATEGINIIAGDLSATGTITLHVENEPLARILDYIAQNLGVQFYLGENVIWVAQVQSAQPGIPMETRMYRLRKGLAGDELDAAAQTINIVEAIERFVPKPPNADLLFDRKAHVLIVKNTRENLRKIEDIIESLDVTPPQILIEARFISTQVADLHELGIDWILNSPITVTKKRVLRDGVPVSEPKTEIPATAPKAIVGFEPFTTQGQGLNLTYQGLLTDPMFRAVLHALETSGKSRTLSVPKVTTINNRPATMRIGEDFRYFEEYDVQSVPSSVTTGGSQVYSTTLVPVGSPSVEELGIQLRVTPSVGSDMSSITLRVTPEISEFVRFEQYQIGGVNTTVDASDNPVTNTASVVKVPIFRRSKIETEVIVRSGETVVMGGLISSADTKTERKVPVLSSIPIIGKLFRHDSITEFKQNLLVFVTATILSERGESLVPMAEVPPYSPGS